MSNDFKWLCGIYRLPSLLEELRQFQEDLHRPPPLSRDVMVTNGGQHGIYQCVELLLEPGDPLITTEYAYTGLHSTVSCFKNDTYICLKIRSSV